MRQTNIVVPATISNKHPQKPVEFLFFRSSYWALRPPDQIFHNFKVTESLNERVFIAQKLWSTFSLTSKIVKWPIGYDSFAGFLSFHPLPNVFSKVGSLRSSHLSPRPKRNRPSISARWTRPNEAVCPFEREKRGGFLHPRFWIVFSAAAGISAH